MNRLENARIEETKKKERFENLGKVKGNTIGSHKEPQHVKTSSLEIGHIHSVIGIC